MARQVAVVHSAEEFDRTAMLVATIGRNKRRVVIGTVDLSSVPAVYGDEVFNDEIADILHKVAEGAAAVLNAELTRLVRARTTAKLSRETGRPVRRGRSRS